MCIFHKLFNRLTPGFLPLDVESFFSDVESLFAGFLLGIFG